METREVLLTALEVRRGRLKLQDVPQADRPVVVSTIRSLTDAQMARVARSQEQKRGRFRTR